jgi:hypothetical protein
LQHRLNIVLRFMEKLWGIRQSFQRRSLTASRTVPAPMMPEQPSLRSESTVEVTRLG